MQNVLSPSTIYDASLRGPYCVIRVGAQLRAAVDKCCKPTDGGRRLGGGIQTTSRSLLLPQPTFTGELCSQHVPPGRDFILGCFVPPTDDDLQGVQFSTRD